MTPHVAPPASRMRARAWRQTGSCVVRRHGRHQTVGVDGRTGGTPTGALSCPHRRDVDRPSIVAEGTASAHRFPHGGGTFARIPPTTAELNTCRSERSASADSEDRYDV
jgi:hypothetical protein